MKNYFFHCLLPLIFGIFIYISFRNTNILIWNWLEIFGIGDFFSIIRETCSLKKINYSNLIIFNLPNGLWVYSFTATLILFKVNKIYFFVPLFLAYISEIFQSLNYISGTFDYLDLLFYLLGFIFAYYLLLNKYVKNSS